MTAGNESGRAWAGVFEDIGRFSLMVAGAFVQAFKRPFELRSLVYQLDHLGVKSLSIVAITALFTGMVLALQSAYALTSFGAKSYIAEIVSLTIVRELGPVLTALLVGGRVGAGIAAEIGTMAVTDQIDAIRAMGTSPLKKVVFPKVLAIVIMLPLLTVIADVVGIFGGLVIATVQLGITPSFYYHHVVDIIVVGDLASGLGKTVFFGLEIAAIACYMGLKTTGGADGVGRSTTRTVVLASITILVSDFFLTKLFMVA